MNWNIYISKQQPEHRALLMHKHIRDFLFVAVLFTFFGLYCVVSCEAEAWSHKVPVGNTHRDKRPNSRVSSLHSNRRLTEK